MACQHLALPSGSVRRILGLAALLLLLTPLRASGEEALPWLVDVKQAKAQAAKESKDLFINFTGSDWCGWCKRLDAEVFDHQDFIEKASKKFVFLFLDFPMSAELKRKVVDAKLNDQLMQSYGVRGFPTIILADADGIPYASTGYRKGGPEAYLKHVEKLYAQGAQVKSLLTAKAEPGAERTAALKQAFTLLSGRGLLSHPGFAPLLEEAHAADPDGSQGLRKYAQGMQETRHIEAFLKKIEGKRRKGEFPQQDRDLETLFEVLQKVEYADGESFVKATWFTAEWLRKNRRFGEAKPLYRRLQKAPMIAGNPQAMEGIEKSLRKCDAQESD
ncbi:MAG: thioredoxin family protein [Planctomycetota bacterium]